jgi:hypothetical protein
MRDSRTNRAIIFLIGCAAGIVAGAFVWLMAQ